MHVLGRDVLEKAIKRHADLKRPLAAWLRIAGQSQWNSFADVRRTWSSADFVTPYTIFNVKGNRYRLITEINYLAGTLSVRHVLTHAEYNKGF